MSLASLNFSSTADQGQVMVVRHPVDRTPLKDAKGDAITITLLGLDSDELIQANNAARSRAVESLKEGKKFSAAAADEEGAQALARAAKAWSGIPQAWLDGSDDETPAKFSRENAVKLFSNRGVRWLRDDADKFIGDRGNFLKASPKA